MDLPSFLSRPGVRRAVVATVSGVVFALTATPLQLNFTVLVALVGFAWSLADGRQGFLRGWLFGFATQLVVFRWMPVVMERFTPMSSSTAFLLHLALAAYHALQYAVAGGLATFVARRIPTIPRFITFAIGLYVGCFVPTLLPSTPCGGIARWAFLVQIADVVGERGATFLIAIACALVAEAIVADGRLRRVYAAVAAGVFAVLTIYGLVRMASIRSARDSAIHARVALVQPGFGRMERWDPKFADSMAERLTQLTSEAETQQVDLTIWTELAFPFSFEHGSTHAPAQYPIIRRGVRGPVLTGVFLLQHPNGAGDAKVTNSVVLASNDGGITKSYDKHHLLAFGETVPFGESLPFLKKLFPHSDTFLPGRESVAFDAGNIRVAPLNCFEDTVPEAGREAMASHPNLLADLGNEAWFEQTGEGDIHLTISAMRAIETRRDFVRAVNLGPTSVFDATGTLVQRYDGSEPKAIVADVALVDTPPTFYVQFGDVPLLLLLVAMAAVAVWKHRTRRMAPQPEPAPAPSGAPKKSPKKSKRR